MTHLYVDDLIFFNHLNPRRLNLKLGDCVDLKLMNDPIMDDGGENFIIDIPSQIWTYQTNLKP